MNKHSLKPKLIVISGAPGSGKTSLAKKLTELIQFLYIDSDVLLQNFWLDNTDNPKYDRETVGIPKMFRLIADIGKDYQVSVVIDAAPTDIDSIEALKKVFDVRQIHCQAKNSLDRFYQREINASGDEPDWLEPLMKELKKDIEKKSQPAELGVKAIHVDTTNDYEPNLKQVIDTLGIDEGYKLWNKF